MTEVLLTSYLGQGTHAARPTAPDLAPGSIGIYFETDTAATFVWDGSAWHGFSGGITQLTGDITAGPGSGSQAATLADSGVGAGDSFVETITFDAKGRATDHVPNPRLTVDGDGTWSEIDTTDDDGNQAGIGCDATNAWLWSNRNTPWVILFSDGQAHHHFYDGGGFSMGNPIPADPGPGNLDITGEYQVNGVPLVAGITELTGDITAGPGDGTQAATLADSGVDPGTYFAANITIDAKGRITDAVSSGSAGAGLYAGVLSAIPTQATTGFTTAHNAPYITPVVTDGAQGISIVANAHNTTRHGLYVLTKPVPATPYTVTALIALSYNWTGNYFEGGIGWTDGTKYHYFYISTKGSGQGPGLGVDKFSTISNDTGADAQSSTLNAVPLLLWVSLADDGAGTIYFRTSLDGAQYSEFLHLTKSTAYLGASGYTNLFIGIDPYSATGAMTLMSYREQSP